MIRMEDRKYINKRGGTALKLLKYILGGIAALIVIIVLGGVIAVNVSPKPFIFFLNHMSGLNEVTPRPSDIESFTAQVDIVKDVTYTSTYGSNKLDIFLPKEDKNKNILPLYGLMVVHL